MPAKKHIVLVEDDAMLRKYLMVALSTDGGFQVSTAEDGETGEQLISKTIPDLVLLDIIMPKKNGFEVLAALKKNSITKTIPVIMLSNLGQKTDIDQAKKLGAVDYYVKVDMEVGDIVKKVKEFLRVP